MIYGWTLSSPCVDAADATCAYGGLHFGCPAVEDGTVECIPSKYVSMVLYRIIYRETIQSCNKGPKTNGYWP